MDYSTGIPLSWKTIRGTLWLALLIWLSAASVAFVWTEASEVVIVDPESGEGFVVAESELADVRVLMMLGCFGGLLVGLWIVLKPLSARYLAPLFSVFQGLALGGVSGYYEVRCDSFLMHTLVITPLVSLAMVIMFYSLWLTFTEDLVATAVGLAISLLALSLFGPVSSIFFGHPLRISNAAWAIGLGMFGNVTAALSILSDRSLLYAVSTAKRYQVQT